MSVVAHTTVLTGSQIEGIVIGVSLIALVAFVCFLIYKDCN